MNSRFIRLFAALVALSSGVFDAKARANADSDPAALDAASMQIETRIETLIRSWFAVLEDPGVEAKALRGLLSKAPFELILDGKALRDEDALLAWVSDLRATYLRIDYRLDPIRIRAEGRDRYRVHFAFDSHAVDEANLPHVARREHTWIVRSEPNATPVIVRIEERPLLYFPGSGPQIVCY